MLPYLPVHLRFLLKKPGVLVRQDFVLPAQVSRLRRDILPVSVNVFSRFLTSTDGRPASSWSSLLRGHWITNLNHALLKMHYEEIPQNYYTFALFDSTSTNPCCLGLKWIEDVKPFSSLIEFSGHSNVANVANVVAVCSSWGSPWSPQHGTFARTRDPWPVQLSGAPAVRIRDWSYIA